MAILIQSLSWTLIYALAQGLVVYLSLWLALRLLPTASAGFKYHLSLSALTVLFAWFLATWWQQLHSLPQYTTLSQMSLSRKALTILQPIQDNGMVKSYSRYIFVKPSLASIIAWLPVFYLAGLFLMLARLSAGMLQVFSLRRCGISPPHTSLDDRLILLKIRMRLAGPVQLLISAKAQVPMVIGFLKPVILMPAAAISHLSMAQLETILLHELAHIKRYDYLVNILQAVVETILFFNPFAWMISAIIRREREHCCDDRVLGHTREPLIYATALAALANYAAAGPVLAVAASGESSHHLFNRIKRIMNMKMNPFSYSRMVVAILVVTIITGSVIWLTPSFAGSGRGSSVAAPSKTAQEAMQKANEAEDNQLISRLTADHLIDTNVGFTLRKENDHLFINDVPQKAEISGKYIAGMKQKFLFVEVYPFQEWLKLHPTQVRSPFIYPATIWNYHHYKAGDGC